VDDRGKELTRPCGSMALQKTYVIQQLKHNRW
jgi:hypothetical protein